LRPDDVRDLAATGGIPWRSPLPHFLTGSRSPVWFLGVCYGSIDATTVTVIYTRTPTGHPISVCSCSQQLGVIVLDVWTPSSILFLFRTRGEQICLYCVPRTATPYRIDSNGGGRGGRHCHELLLCFVFVLFFHLSFFSLVYTQADHRGEYACADLVCGGGRSRWTCMWARGGQAGSVGGLEVAVVCLC